MPFFDFRQNNSGGVFDINEDDGISVVVIIEADTAEEANRKAVDIGLYFDGVYKGYDCDCCGDRWYEQSGEGDMVPSVYGEPVQDYRFETGYSIKWNKSGPEAYVHFADGLVQAYGLPKKELS